MMKTKWQFVALALSCALAVNILFAAIQAMADGDPTTDNVPKLIPYQGTLEKDGRVVNGDVQMTFRIYDGLESEQPSWTEAQSVTVYAGRFSVLLGATTTQSSQTLTQIVTNADELYLAVALAQEEGEIQLANRQRFLPAPFALWAMSSASAANFHVGRKLTVAGEGATIGGPDNNGIAAALQIETSNDQMMLIDGNEIDAVGSHTSGSLYLNNNSDGSVLIGSRSHPSNLIISGFIEMSDHLLLYGADGGDGWALHYGTGDKLLIGGAFSGGIELQVNTSLKANQSLDVKPTLDCECEWVDVNTQASSGDTSEWHCPVGKYLQGLKQEDTCGDNDNCIYQISCCRPCRYQTFAGR